MCGVDGGGGAVRQTGNGGIHTTRTNHFTCLIGSSGDYRQPLGDAGMGGSFSRHDTQFTGRGHQVGQHGRVNWHGLPLPIGFTAPGQGLVIEWDVANL